MNETRRITILASHFWPETNAAGRRLTAAAEHFRNAGWQVTVVAPAPHHPENEVHSGYESTWRRVSNEDGITVVRFAPFLVPPSKLALRLLSESLFTFKAAVQALFTKPDVVIASSPYMFLGPGGLFAARLARASFAWDVRDLTWKYVKATGRRTYGLERLLDAIMSFTARNSDMLTTATTGQMDELGKVAKGRRAVITNGLTKEFIADLQGGVPSLTDGRFTVVYAGLLGFPQGLGTLLDAAALSPDTRFIVAGDGPERATLETRAEELTVVNVEFLGQLGIEQLRNLYASADLLVGMLRGSDAFKVAQPSKIWEYMATGKPVLFAGDCETTRIMEDEDIGIVVPPEDPAALAAAIRRLAIKPEWRAQIGRKGQTFVEAERQRDKILDTWENLLRSTT